VLIPRIPWLRQLQSPEGSWQGAETDTTSVTRRRSMAEPATER